jgi:mono/diheme cytochrome c family protein
MTRATIFLLLSTLAFPALARPQGTPEALKAGEQVFNRRCANGYCHGARGTAAGAPRLAARGFDRAFIRNTVTQGVPGTAMAAFEKTLSPAELNAVVSYLADLNGIAASERNPLPSDTPSAQSTSPGLSPKTLRGRDLFSDSGRGFGRCSTCHEVDRIGIPVATPIASVPRDAQALRAVATPEVTTATADHETMPALVVRNTSQSVIFFDLTISPPVLTTRAPGKVGFTPGSKWRHSSVIGSYNDAELDLILDFLRATQRP